MFFSIVPRFGKMRFLLCLEWLDADWLSGCVCLEGLHSDCFCCMWYCYHAFSLDECPFCPVGVLFSRSAAKNYDRVNDDYTWRFRPKNVFFVDISTFTSRRLPGLFPTISIIFLIFFIE